MENPTTSSRGPKIALMGGIAVLAIVAIVYFSFFYPPAKTEDVSGTIGAAKKYRSEQITDKDVKLEGQSTEAISSTEGIADVQAAHEFAAVAGSFENTFKSLDNTMKLDAAFRNAYQRAALAMNSMAKSMERAPSSSYDARMVADLRSNAAALERTASNLLGQKSQGLLDRQAALDMRAQMNSIGDRASALQRTMEAAIGSRALDSRPSAGIDAKPKIDARPSSMDNKVKSSLDNRTSAGNKAQ